jgi:hypothetical protein
MFQGAGSITVATVENLAQYAGKIVSVMTPTTSIGWAKFSAVSDPLSVETVHEDGSSFDPPIVQSIPIADIRAMWEYGKEDQPAMTARASAPTAQASAAPPWLLPAVAIPLGVYLMWRSGFLSEFLSAVGIMPKRKAKRRARRSHGRRSKGGRHA